MTRQKFDYLPFNPSKYNTNEKLNEFYALTYLRLLEEVRAGNMQALKPSQIAGIQNLEGKCFLCLKERTPKLIRGGLKAYIKMMELSADKTFCKGTVRQLENSSFIVCKKKEQSDLKVRIVRFKWRSNDNIYYLVHGYMYGAQQIAEEEGQQQQQNQEYSACQKNKHEMNLLKKENNDNSDEHSYFYISSSCDLDEQPPQVDQKVEYAPNRNINSDAPAQQPHLNQSKQVNHKSLKVEVQMEEEEIEERKDHNQSAQSNSRNNNNRSVNNDVNQEINNDKNNNNLNDQMNNNNLLSHKTIEELESLIQETKETKERFIQESKKVLEVYNSNLFHLQLEIDNRRTLNLFQD